MTGPQRELRSDRRSIAPMKLVSARNLCRRTCVTAGDLAERFPRVIDEDQGRHRASTSPTIRCSRVAFTPTSIRSSPGWAGRTSMRSRSMAPRRRFTTTSATAFIARPSPAAAWPTSRTRSGVAGAQLLDAAGIPAKLVSGEQDPGLLLLNGDDADTAIEQLVAAIASHRHFERETDPPRV